MYVVYEGLGLPVSVSSAEGTTACPGVPMVTSSRLRGAFNPQAATSSGNEVATYRAMVDGGSYGRLPGVVVLKRRSMTAPGA